MRPNHGVVLTFTDDVGLPLDPPVPNSIAHCVRSLTSYLRYIILTSSRRLKDPSPIRDDEVLIRVKMTSICGTDIHIFTWDEWSQGRVNPPYVFGHEFAGEVMQIGASVSNVSVGDCVSAETHIVCGTCRQCLTGQFHICKKTNIIGVDKQGCFAEYIALPAKNLWKNPSDMPLDMATIQEPMGRIVEVL